MVMRRLLAIWLVVLLAACATPDPDSISGSSTDDSAQKQQDRIESQPLKHLLGRKLKPIPERPLDVRTRCRFHDVSGGRGSMDLQVSKAEVRRFSAEVSVPRQGICRFDMKGFRQTARLPNVVLSDEASGCVVRIWEQERNVTVAFNECRSKCSGDAYSYLWPIMVDTRNGRCS